MNFRLALFRLALVAPIAVAGWSAIALAQSSAPAPPPALDPVADKILAKTCQTLGSADAFSFHADVMFDQVLPGIVKVQYGGAMDYAVQRPSELAIWYRSDLGGKDLWYGNGSLTLFDPKHGMYATAAVPSTIDAMLDQVADKQRLTMPLSDLMYSNPCARPKKIAVYSGYLGVSSVQGVPCDHLALSSSKDDFQIWIDRSGKPLPRKIVINHRSEQGSPEYIAILSGWKFPKDIASSRFQPQLPKDAKQITFIKAEEAKP
jgi:hypothetical protein